MGHPSVYVWDCNAAGTIVKSFHRFAEDHEKDWRNRLDEHKEKRPPPLPTIGAEMDLDQQAKAFGFEAKPNFKVSHFSVLL
jgi:hypothetical protein